MNRNSGFTFNQCTSMFVKRRAQRLLCERWRTYTLPMAQLTVPMDLLGNAVIYSFCNGL